MRFDRLSPYELANFVENLITLLTGTELSAIDPAIRAALVAELGPLPALLRSQQADVSGLIGELESAYTVRNKTMGIMVDGTRRVRKTLEAADAPEDQWALCNIAKPGKRRREYVAVPPENLKVSGYFQGAIRGKFLGKNKSGAVFYEVFRRTEEEGPWAMHMSVKVPSFVDEDVTFDGSYWYRVRARSSKNASEFRT